MDSKLCVNSWKHPWCKILIIVIPFNIHRSVVQRRTTASQKLIKVVHLNGQLLSCQCCQTVCVNTSVCRLKGYNGQRTEHKKDKKNPKPPGNKYSPVPTKESRNGF